MSNLIQENQIFIFSILSVIVFALATYLGFLANKVKLQNKMNEIRKQEIETLKNQREQSIKESIEILARAVVNNQCEVSEGVVRIKKLSEIIELNSHENFKVINDMYEKIKHFAILDERNELSKQEKYNQDKERFVIEDQYSTEIKKACEGILASLKQ